MRLDSGSMFANFANVGPESGLVGSWAAPRQFGLPEKFEPFYKSENAAYKLPFLHFAQI